MKQIIVFTVMLLSLSSAHSQVGKVGINTTIPAAMLHVKDSSVLFTGPSSLPSAAGAPPVSGAGNRMMWYADKAAFRAGRVADASWDKDNIGNSSVGIGNTVKASGLNSTAFGFATEATGSFSTALGYGTLASNNITTAFGDGSRATGNTATAMGRYTIASGTYSTAMGDSAIASGQSATAMGYRSQATGISSFAIGDSAIASNTSSIAMGNRTLASGAYSMALGLENSAAGDGSTAFGSYNVADGIASTVFGNGNTANGSYSTVFGLENNTNGSYSTALGRSNFTFGEYSTVFGLNNNAAAYCSVVLGRYNSNPSSSFSSWVNTEPLFIIGNGTSAFNRSNAFMVLKNGNTGIGVDQPAEKLEVSGNVVAGEYKYSAAQTKYLSLPTSAFQLMPVDGVSSSGISTTTLSGGQTLLSGTAGVNAYYEAPVYLPEGAIVTAVLLNVRDASSTYEVSAELREVNGITSSVVAAISGTGTTAAPGNTTINAIGLNVLVNSQRPCFLRFNTIEFNGNLRIYNARITYTVNSVD